MKQNHCNLIRRFLLKDRARLQENVLLKTKYLILDSNNLSMKEKEFKSIENF